MKDLYQFLKSTINKPFEWGANDCCTLASGAVMAQGYKDPMKEFRGRYKTERGAKQALKRLGYECLADAVSAKLNEIPKAYAQTGNPVLLVTGQMGVKTPNGVWVITAEGGVEIHPTFLEIEKAWEVNQWQQQ